MALAHKLLIENNDPTISHVQLETIALLGELRADYALLSMRTARSAWEVSTQDDKAAAEDARDFLLKRFPKLKIEIVPTIVPTVR